MIVIVDDYILIFTSLAGILWGFVRYLLAPGSPAANSPHAGSLVLWWALQSALIFGSGAAVLLMVARVGTENAVSDVVSLAACALYLGLAFLPRRGYRSSLAGLDRAILLLLAVLLLTGSLYDNFIR